MKPIRFSKHSLFELQRRGLSVAEVTNVIRNPEQIIPSDKGRSIHQSLIGPKRRMLLRVILKEDAQSIVVVTAYKTSKIAKYWSGS